MNRVTAMSRRVRYAITCTLCVAVAACSSETTAPVSPLAPRAAQATQLHHVSVYDCAVDQSQLPVTECQALVALYASTNGAAWTHSSGWLQIQTSPCTWYGIVCGSGFVQNVLLYQNNLTGSIPASLGSLTQLRQLYLHLNQLSGPIPAALGSLAQLQILEMADNSLSGAIPASLGSLTQLQVLSLGANQLSGSIPASLGSLTQLQQLFLADNSLTGNLPNRLGNLTSLQYLVLSNNQLSGLISLPAARRLGVLESRGTCSLSGNAGLVFGSGPGYHAADRNHDGFICFLPVP